MGSLCGGAYTRRGGLGQGDVIDRARFEQQLPRSGITPDLTVVLYSSVNNLLATFKF
jgi:3-mercaptopyruvate sulfurtransferase SseA